MKEATKEKRTKVKRWTCDSLAVGKGGNNKIRDYATDGGEGN